MKVKIDKGIFLKHVFYFDEELEEWMPDRSYLFFYFAKKRATFLAAFKNYDDVCIWSSECQK